MDLNCIKQTKEDLNIKNDFVYEIANTTSGWDFEQLFNTMANGMRVIDRNHNHIKMNSAFLEMAKIDIERSPIVGKCFETFCGSFCHTNKCTLKRILDGEKIVRYRVEKVTTQGDSIMCLLTATPLYSLGGKLIGIIEDFKDITEQQISENMLRTRENELRTLNIHLRSKKNALNEILNNIEIEKEVIKENININVAQDIIPLIRKIRSQKQINTVLCDLLEQSLATITSSFYKTLNDYKFILTQSEMKICKFVIDGLQEKDICNLINISKHTLKAHKRNIRRKIGITNNSMKLKTYLQINIGYRD